MFQFYTYIYILLNIFVILNNIHICTIQSCSIIYVYLYKIDCYIFTILLNDLPIRYDAAPVNARRISFGY